MNQFKFASGTYLKQNQYDCFIPAPLNRAKFDWHSPALDPLLEQATRMLGELNAYSQLVPDVDFFIRMHIYKEATASSAIEGTQTGLDEALMQEDEIEPERRDDWIEVQNYTKAMNHAIAELESLPLSMRLLNSTHHILMSGARGQFRGPGEIRRSQNWIGGATLKDAFFVPPPAEKLPGLLSDLEKFWHNDRMQIPQIIKAAISHYQFETIHPYLDGNGRTGRLLTTLYLVSKGLLKKPTLYLSDFFERNRSTYYDALTFVRTRNDLEHWLKFFLVGIEQTATKSKQTFEGIIELRRDCEHKAMLLGKRAKIALQLLNWLYSQPIANSKMISSGLDITTQSANTLVKAFETIGILREMTGYKRNRLFIFQKYFDLFNSRPID